MKTKIITDNLMCKAKPVSLIKRSNKITSYVVSLKMKMISDQKNFNLPIKDIINIEKTKVPTQIKRFIKKIPGPRP